jgi:flagellar protein FliJ
MKHVLPLLIERAQAQRDRQALASRQARQSAAQADATLQRLGEFRGECLSRSAAAQLGQADGASLAGYQAFVGRLDEAIGMQGREAALRAGVAHEQQQRLLQQQRRVLALEALARRDALQCGQREQRREQRTTDDFAARAAAPDQDPFA